MGRRNATTRHSLTRYADNGALSDFGLVWASGKRIETALFNELSKFVGTTASTRATTLQESFKRIDRLVEAASADRYGVSAFFGVSRLRILYDVLGLLSGCVCDR